MISDPHPNIRQVYLYFHVKTQFIL